MSDPWGGSWGPSWGDSWDVTPPPGTTYDTWGGSWGNSWALHWTRTAAPAVVPGPSGGAGRGQASKGARRRQFPFPNRYDDPEVFREPEPVEAHPVQAEGDPAPTSRAPSGPVGLTELGRQGLLRKPVPFVADLPSKPDTAAIKARAAKRAADKARAAAEAKAAAEAEAARLAELRAQEDEEEIAVLRFFEYI